MCVCVCVCVCVCPQKSGETPEASRRRTLEEASRLASVCKYASFVYTRGTRDTMVLAHATHYLTKLLHRAPVRGACVELQSAFGRTLASRGYDTILAVRILGLVAKMMRIDSCLARVLSHEVVARVCSEEERLTRAMVAPVLSVLERITTHACGLVYLGADGTEVLAHRCASCLTWCADTTETKMVLREHRTSQVAARAAQSLRSRVAWSALHSALVCLQYSSQFPAWDSKFHVFSAE